MCRRSARSAGRPCSLPACAGRPVASGTSRYVICSMTSSGLEMPPVQNAFQMASICDFSSPVTNLTVPRYSPPAVTAGVTRRGYAASTGRQGRVSLLASTTPAPLREPLRLMSCRAMCHRVRLIDSPILAASSAVERCDRLLEADLVPTPWRRRAQLAELAAAPHPSRRAPDRSWQRRVPLGGRQIHGTSLAAVIDTSSARGTAGSLDVAESPKWLRCAPRCSRLSCPSTRAFAVCAKFGECENRSRCSTAVAHRMERGGCGNPVIGPTEPVIGEFSKWCRGLPVAIK